MRFIAKLILLCILVVGTFLLTSLPFRANPDECTVDEHDTSSWVTSDEFFLPWNDSSESFFYDPNSISPADKYIKIDGDHFEYAVGGRIKFWGINIIAGAAFPSYSEAEKTAQRLAKLGFNLVVFHQINNQLTGSANSYDINDTGSNMDKLDYFINELKKNGIYVVLPLIEHFQFKDGDEVKDWLELNNGLNRRRRAVGIFDTQDYSSQYNGVVWIQKEYAQNLLSHTNPYTGNQYADEPALLMVKLNNEVSLFNRWKVDTLNYKDSIYHLTSYYSEQLDEKWNGWLTSKYGDQSGLESAWGSGCLDGETLPNISRITYSERDSFCNERFKDTGNFYASLHQQYFQSMQGVVEGLTAGRDLPVTGINNFYGMRDKIASYEGLSLMTQNLSWEHPPSWDESDFLNTPMVNMNTTQGTCSYSKDKPCFAHWIETKSTISRGAFSSAFSGSPLVITEYSYQFPKEFVAEYPLIGAAYGSFQNWDAMVIHAYKGGEPGSFGDKYIHSRFNLFNNPVVMSQMPIASRLFRKGYVTEALSTCEISYTKDEALQLFKEFGDPSDPDNVWGVNDANYIYRYIQEKGLDLHLPLVHGVRNTLGGITDACSASAPYESDTGELDWDPSKGIVTVNAGEVQAAIGFIGAHKTFIDDHLSNLSVDSNTDFGALSLLSLNGSAIPNSERLLLNASSRLLNSGLSTSASGYNSCSCQLSSWGGKPMLIQPVRAQVTLKLPGVTNLRVYRLDGTGAIDQSHEIPVSKSGDEFTFTIGKQDRNDNTLWYGIELERIEDTKAVFRVNESGDVFADSAYFGKEFKSGSADLAEYITVSEPVTPGDVVELDPSNPGEYRKSSMPYSTLAAGVISTQPGFILGLKSPDSAKTDKDSKFHALLALRGIVPVKATVENGPIYSGDLLTSSSRPGYAMKCTDKDNCIGALIGKALEPLEEDQGTIKMLIMH